VPDEKTTKNQRREAAREAARLQREKQKRRDFRTRIFVRGGVTLGILAIAAIVVLVIVQSTKPTGPGPINMASDGVVLTGTADGLAVVPTKSQAADADPTPTDTDAIGVPVNIVEYVDLLCPFCQQFEATNGATIESLVQGGFASVEIHPISILDSKSLGTKYSTRAASAMGCVANYEPESFLDVLAAMYATGTQPAEGTAGLTNKEIAGVVSTAGVTSDKVAKCITDETFTGWVTAATNRALADPDLKNAQGGFGTPTVFVNGARYEGSLTDAAAFSAFVSDQYTPTDPTATPTPTPTPTP
jgi:protein-disulfide isomerase